VIVESPRTSIPAHPGHPWLTQEKAADAAGKRRESGPTRPILLNSHTRTHTHARTHAHARTHTTPHPFTYGTMRAGGRACRDLGQALPVPVRRVRVVVVRRDVLIPGLGVQHAGRLEARVRVQYDPRPPRTPSPARSSSLSSARPQPRPLACGCRNRCLISYRTDASGASFDPTNSAASDIAHRGARRGGAVIDAAHQQEHPRGGTNCSGDGNVVRYVPCAEGKLDSRSLKYWVRSASAPTSVTDTGVN
jgi:hypothetical protein